MEGRRTSRHSIIRYMPSDLKGEVINIGVIIHLVEGEKGYIKYHLLDENSPKLKAILETSFELNEYKSFKNVIEHYLSQDSNMFDSVGVVNFGSIHSEDFLNQLYNSFESKKMFFSEPMVSRSSNIDKLFEVIHNRYVGKGLLLTDEKNINVKKYVRQVFENEGVLDKKVKQNLSIHPFKELETLKINIDFSFRNGVWNYLQAIPAVSGPSKTAEWFAKINLLLDALEGDDETMVHLIYRSSEISSEKETLDTMNYLLSKRSGRITRLDLDDKIAMRNLLYKINHEAYDFEKIS